MAREAEVGSVTILSVLHFDVATVFLLLPVSYPLCEMHTDYSFFPPLSDAVRLHTVTHAFICLHSKKRAGIMEPEPGILQYCICRKIRAGGPSASRASQDPSQMIVLNHRRKMAAG